MLLEPSLRRGGLCTSPPTLVPIPLSVEMMLALGLFTPVPCGGEGGGGREVLRTDELATRPLLGSVRESQDRGEVVFGTEGVSTLVGVATLEPMFSSEKVLWEGA